MKQSLEQRQEHDGSNSLLASATMKPQTAQGHKARIIELVQSLARRHNQATVFGDFVTMAAIALSKADLRQAVARESMYMAAVRKYSPEEAASIREMFFELQLALEAEPRDILGEIYMSLEMGSKRSGQFFTPHHLCMLTARLTVDDSIHTTIGRDGFATLNDPASGGGAMLIATLEVMRERGINYQKVVHVTATDVDHTAAMMSYVQLSLLGAPAVVVHGNTLTLEEYSHWFTPAHIFGNWSAKCDRRTRLREREAEAGEDEDQDGGIEDDASIRPA